jgi:uncharacterized cysteine cluster protein YcgN (CxxCxxCC family)
LSQPPFWKRKTLTEMSLEEWESLCDRCGKCCVLKIEDADTGEVHYTDVACRLLDCGNATCTDYPNRKTFVPDCITLSPQNLETLTWMPDSCAYRIIADGGDLPAWHPLVSGDPKAAKPAGATVAGRVFPEDSVDESDMIDHITTW